MMLTPMTRKNVPQYSQYGRSSQPLGFEIRKNYWRCSRMCWSRKKYRCDRKSCFEPEKSKLDIRGLLKYEKIIEGALGCADHEKNIGATESHVLSEKSQNEKSSQWIRSPSSETSRKGPNPFKVLDFQPPHPFIMPPSAVRWQLVGTHMYLSLTDQVSMLKKN